jgi:predicted heme/steroid binding protein
MIEEHGEMEIEPLGTRYSCNGCGWRGGRHAQGHNARNQFGEHMEKAHGRITAEMYNEDYKVCLHRGAPLWIVKCAVLEYGG